MKKILTYLLAILGIVGISFAEDERRILAIGGTVTEIIYMLDGQEELVGRDTTSSYPPEAVDLPDVGYIRALAPEGVLSVEPTMIIAEASAGPLETIETLKSTGINYVEVDEGFTANVITRKIEIVGQAIGKVEAAEALASKVALQIAKAKAKANNISEKKRVLFVLSNNEGELRVGGAHSSADAIITMAGGINVAKEINGYKSITNEAIITENPDVIIMMNRHGTDDVYLSVLTHPSIKLTNAGRNQALIKMDGLLMLGFGPRTGEAITQLSNLIYPEK